MAFGKTLGRKKYEQFKISMVNTNMPMMVFGTKYWLFLTGVKHTPPEMLAEKEGGRDIMDLINEEERRANAHQENP